MLHGLVLLSAAALGAAPSAHCDAEAVKTEAPPFPPPVTDPKAPWDRPGFGNWNPLLASIAFPVGSLAWRRGQSRPTTTGDVVVGIKPNPLRVIVERKADKAKEMLPPRHLLPLWAKRSPALTAPVRNDGVGAQFHCVYAVMAVAMAFKMPFCHTPIRSIGHGEHRVVRSWEEYFGFQSPAFRAWCPVEPSVVQRRPRAADSALQGTLGPVQVEFCGHQVTKAHNAFYYNSNVTKAFRWLFWASPKPEVWGLQTAKPRIALHVRRGDSLFKTPDRVVPLWVFQELLESLRKKYPGASYHIHSEGNDVDEFKAADVTLYKSESLKATFARMVSADVLVLSISQLSWIIAMLSCGEVYYPHLWVTNSALRHPPLQHWKPFGPRRAKAGPNAATGRKKKVRLPDHPPPELMIPTPVPTEGKR